MIDTTTVFAHRLRTFSFFYLLKVKSFLDAFAVGNGKLIINGSQLINSAFNNKVSARVPLTHSRVSRTQH